MKILIALAAVAALAGCSSTLSRVGDDLDKTKTFVGSPHGYAGHISTDDVDVQGFPTIAPEGTYQIVGEHNADGSSKDAVSTYTVEPSGRVTASGVAAQLLVLGNFCAHAPQASLCQPQ